MNSELFPTRRILKDFPSNNIFLKNT